MSQSKKGSLLEAFTGTMIGLVYAMPLNYIICSLNGFPLSFKNNAILTFWMTIASVIRTYVLRRFFNWLPRWWRHFRCRNHSFAVVDTQQGDLVMQCRHCEMIVVHGSLET